MTTPEFVLGRVEYIKKTFGIECHADHLKNPDWKIPVQPYKEKGIAGYIDHTLLKPEATVDQIDKVCKEAIEYRFASVCVNGYWARHCLDILGPQKVPLTCVIGFPLGAMTTAAKVAETKELVGLGVDEIDMVLNIGAFMGGDYKTAFYDIKRVADTCHDGARKATLKVILETSLLDTEERVVDACLLSAAAGADFVKTSTGFHATGGAKVHHLKIMRTVVGEKLGVKASGGVRTYEDAVNVMEAGASRIGASAGIAIQKGQSEAK